MNCLESPRELSPEERERFQLLDEQGDLERRRENALRQEAMRLLDAQISDGRLVQDAVETLARNRTLGDTLMGEIRKLARLRWDDAYELGNRALSIARSADASSQSLQIAQPCSQSAVDASPDNWDLQLTLGITEYRLGDFKAALRTLSLARDLLERQSLHRSPTLHLFQAMAFSRLGDRSAARDEYDLAEAWSTHRKTAEAPDLETFFLEARALLAPEPAQGGAR